MKPSDRDLGEYVDTLIEKQGIAVATVDDGWVFTFDKEWMRQLLDSNEKDRMIVFIQSSSKRPAN